ncbi:MAG: 4-hydroxybutyrate CoA-transferase [Saprospiraceae bacterium]|nr:4-hydroxybutyrate CoA-transferase [Saprospiraceae bacterium]
MKNTRTISVQEAVQAITSGSHVFIHSVAAAPQALVQGMVERADRLKNVRLYHIHTEGAAEYARPEYKDVFHDNSFFVGANVRDAVRENRADYIPVLLSDLGSLFRQGIVPLDVALISVSKPDKNGYMSLGVSVDVSLAALRAAKIVIAQVNSYMPHTHGDGIVHLRDIDYLVECNEPLPVAAYPAPNETELAVGAQIAALIPDGATLQLGIGGLPNAVLQSLGSHKNLGVHNEMFSDGLIPLLESGVVNNSQKAILAGLTVSSFLFGSKNLYDFVDHHPAIVMKEMSWVNDPYNIARNPRVVAINSAIEVDLTGQVCADSIGQRMYSGVGGQADFIFGAAHSAGGFPIIAMTSRTHKGVSKISPTLRLGAGVTVTRAHIHWVVTEFGAVNLQGKNLRERAELLISIAHPEDREMLEKAAWERWGTTMVAVAN